MAGRSSRSARNAEDLTQAIRDLRVLRWLLALAIRSILALLVSSPLIDRQAAADDSTPAASTPSSYDQIALPSWGKESF